MINHRRRHLIAATAAGVLIAQARLAGSQRVSTRAQASGELVFEWVDDASERGTERARLAVTG